MFDYSKDFDVAMYKKIQEGMTYVEAYNALGFDTKVLGEDRANAAGKRVMKQMNLVAQVPHRDAYKHQASHNHVCAAPPNAIGQDFFVGPRQVILTDITYLYYGPARETFYLCVFRDAYVRQNLGWAAGPRMDAGQPVPLHYLQTAP